MIKFENVSKAYVPNKFVISDINLDIQDGEFFVLIGPSGCGKTTLLKMINRLIPLTTGYIYVQEKPIDEYNIQELRWNMGYVLQQIALFPNMTVEENIMTVPEMKKWPKEKMHNRVTELLESVGLNPESYRNRKTSELSGGEQQRVGVLRALAADPDIILMDEPFSALDPISRQNLQHDVAEMHRKWKKTIVFVTHDMQEAISLGTRIALINEGEIVQVGTPEEIVSQPKNKFVKNFLKSGNIQTKERRTIQELIDVGYMKPLKLYENVDLFLRTDDTLEELIVALSKQNDVLIKNEEDKVIGRITSQQVVAYLATDIEKRGAIK